ncbi:hypothetical protein IQ07DRAFT_592549 [Pyrenochaeta sp. DS3sAY3a]|nr:hypothetical protein IQ07DRAFT_592549 [Pyrenochaeta sp. DS3sAY3a]
MTTEPQPKPHPHTHTHPPPRKSIHRHPDPTSPFQKTLNVLFFPLGLSLLVALLANTLLENYRHDTPFYMVVNGAIFGAAWMFTLFVAVHDYFDCKTVSSAQRLQRCSDQRAADANAQVWIDAFRGLGRFGQAGGARKVKVVFWGGLVVFFVVGLVEGRALVFLGVAVGVAVLVGREEVGREKAEGEAGEAGEDGWVDVWGEREVVKMDRARIPGSW